MKLAFHKGNAALSRAIEYVTHSPYSHVELIFSDGLSFSARAERTPAVDIIPFDGSDKLWDFVEIPAKYDESAARKLAESRRGWSYDWADDAHFLLPMGAWTFGEKDESPKALMCSASCTLALQAAGLFKSFTPSKVSPGQLAVMAQVLSEVAG